MIIIRTAWAGPGTTLALIRETSVMLTTSGWVQVSPQAFLANNITLQRLRDLSAKLYSQPLSVAVTQTSE